MLKNTNSVKNYKELLNKAISSLNICIDQIGQINGFKYIPSDENGIDPDIKATFKIGFKDHLILGEVFNKGEAREARLAVERIERYLKESPNAHGVMIAPYITEKAVGICKKGGVGTVDFAGNCLLSWENIHLEIKGNINPFPKRSYLNTIYTPRASRVLRVLLNDPKHVWKMQELANEASVSLAQVAHVKKHLEDREWITTGRGKLQLINPGEMLSDWSNNYKNDRDEVHYFYSLNSIENMKGILQEAFDRRHQRFVMAGFSGASFYYPFVNYNVEMAYTTDVVLTAAALNLKSVDSGANFILIKPLDEGVFYGEKLMDGIPVASPIQVYLDLITRGGRSKDGAEALLEQVIKPTW